jgi:hypothetical protein
MKRVAGPALARLLLAAPLLLVGCDWLGIESPDQIAATFPDGLELLLVDRIECCSCFKCAPLC